jgi:hypothetical protein
MPSNPFTAARFRVLFVCVGTLVILVVTAPSAHVRLHRQSLFDWYESLNSCYSGCGSAFEDIVLGDGQQDPLAAFGQCGGTSNVGGPFICSCCVLSGGGAIDRTRLRVCGGGARGVCANIPFSVC